MDTVPDLVASGPWSVTLAVEAQMLLEVAMKLPWVPYIVDIV